MLSFWERLEELIHTQQLVIDRPKGSSHPKYPSVIYPLDYGYLSDTDGGDGNGIDVWLGSLPEQRLDAVICTVDSLKKDSEIKLLLGCIEAEKQIIEAFHANKYMSGILVRRDFNSK